MRRPLHTVIETPEFRSQVAGLLGAEELGVLVDYLAEHANAGDLIPGTGGARKLRWAALGKGKRGGARVITYYAGARVPVFLLTFFGKGSKANLSKAECNELRRVLHDLVSEYLKGVSRHVESRRKHP